ncbi:MAG: T9SS type A sorting domain-containing protein [Bacteroidales bacterium]|nr:T9SS type A sorting domain-containing protein [Bacteroidales bacterium]
MRRLILLLTVIFPATILFGQQKLEVISSAGGYSVSGGISISWTLGETIIPNFTSPDGTITLAHGFQQKLIITKVEEAIGNPVLVTVYPNPASEYVRIEFDQPVDAEIRLSVIDFRGKVVLTEPIVTGTSLYEVNMQSLSSGIYYLRLQKGRFLNVYRVVKL